MQVLRVSLRARVDDFDAFFKRNFADYRAPLFEKQKFRLRKLLAEGEATESGARGELDIRFAIDDSANAHKHNALRNERPKTPVRVPAPKTKPKAPAPVKTERSKSPLRQPQTQVQQPTVVRVQMTREEYEAYTRQPPTNKQNSNRR